MMDERKRFKRLIIIAALVGSAFFAIVLATTMHLQRGPVMGELAGPKHEYIGHWKSQGYVLAINRDTTVDVQHHSEHSNSHFGGRIMKFDGPSFEVWTPPMFPVTFHVTQPPTLRDGHWHMTLDGADVERVE